MLTPEYLLHATEPAEEIAEQLHIDLVNRIVERMMIRLKRGDKYLLTSTDKWQIETLQQAGILLEDIQKELAKATKKLQKEIAEAMEDAGVRSLEYDDEIYRKAGLDPTPLRQSPNLIRIMQRDFEATMGDWENFTRTTANSIHTEFINACDTAYHQVITGGLSSTQAVAEALEKAISGGVVVRYPSGHEDTIETATARAVRTGISQATAHITDQRMDEMEWDTILVSSHFGARVTDKVDFTNHYWWQGKFYSKSGNDPRFPPFSVCNMGHVQGIHGAGCRHHHGPGDGENNPFQEFDAEENKKQYELEQKQRTMERRIRKTKRELQNMQNAIDKETDPAVKNRLEKQFERKSALLKKQNEAYNDFCEETGQSRLPDRINIAKWKRSETAKRSIKAAKDYEKRVANERNSDSITVRDSNTPLINEETNPASNRLQNSLLAVTDHNKIQRYALNSNHPKGKEKARVFNSVLGYHYENWQLLSDQIYDKLQTSNISRQESTKYGERFIIPMRITGLRNKSMVVNTVWQIDKGTVIPRLITLTFDKRTIRGE